MIRILIVSNQLGSYGAENALINLTKVIDKTKYDVTVLTLKQCDSSVLPEGVHYKHIFSNGGVKSKIKNKVLLSLGYKKLGIIFGKGYDIGISFKMGESAQIVAHSSAPKKYCWIHSNVTELQEPCSYSFSNINDELSLLQKFDSMIAVSYSCKESFEKKYLNGHKTEWVRVIYNPCDSEDVIRKAEEPIMQEELDLFEGGVPVLGTVARIDSQKGIDRLIECSRRLDLEGIEHRFVVIGDGVLLSDYKMIVNQMGLNNFHFLGFKSNPYPYVKKMDVFICSSISESYSLVVNEALILNKIVISTRCGGPEEVLEQGRFGYLVDNDLESLYIGIKKYLSGEFRINERYNCNPMETFCTNIAALLEE